MNNFFGVCHTQKPTKPKGTASARICFAAFRQDNSAGHGYFYAGTESPYKSQTGGAGFMTQAP